MRLDGVLSQAASGLASIQAQLSNVSQNVANANTPGYTTEMRASTSVVAGNDAEGVRTGVATRTVDGALQMRLFAAGGEVADGEVRAGVLAAIDEASGAPGSGQDLAGLVGALGDAFSTLKTDPANQTQQRAVVQAAGALATGVNSLAGVVTRQRQAVQDNLVLDVTTANAALARLGQLSLQIITARTQGLSTADMEDKRDTAAQTVAQLTGAKFLMQTNGDLLAVSGGTVLSTHVEGAGPLSVGPAAMGPGVVGPALLVNGVAAPLGGGQAGQGGRIGAELDVRDKVLPTLQHGLDVYANNLLFSFNSAGLTLYTDGGGAFPAAALTGLAQMLKVNPAVVATPRAVRDGVGGGAGAAGSTVLIDKVLAVFASGANTLSGQAAQLVADNAGAAGAAKAKLTGDTAVQTSLSTKLNGQSGVSVDTELSSMVALQNSYGANARVIAAVQAMWTQLLSSVQ